MGSTRFGPVYNPVDFAELLHQVHLGVETARRIDDDGPRTPGPGGLDGVESYRRRVSPRLLADDVDA